MIFLANEQSEYLLGQPEAGMGYQFVEVALRGRPAVAGVAFNAEVVILDNEPPTRLRHAFGEPANRAALQREGALHDGSEVELIRVVSRAWTAPSIVRETGKSEGGPASEAPVESTSSEEEFKRFSAFAKDNRITPTRGLLPGTYATTAADAAHVLTGSAAVQRYALPNPTPAIFRFTIRPPAGTALQRGIVQPAYGQPGGGVEVIFTAGSPDYTVTIPSDVLPA